MRSPPLSPLAVERLVRQYEVLRSEGLSAQEAYAKVSDECARTVNVIRRQQSIMAHQVGGRPAWPSSPDHRLT